MEKDNTVANLIVSTFWTLKGDADFDASLNSESEDKSVSLSQLEPTVERQTNSSERAYEPQGVDFRVGYTINLNLPETTNVEVFNAIFRSLNENLLKRS